MKFGPLGQSGSFGPIPLEIDRTCEVVDRAIMRLDDTEREVIYETYLREDAAQVTARRCGLTYGYYREVLAKARQRVGDFINGAKNAVVFPTD
jgi:DNA-directed RNA polymerase specialized sigma24 family protein